jgi:acetyl esterase/lipase
MTRQGVSVYAMDYPLAPGQAFPVAVTSILNGLLWMKEHRKVHKVTMVGDSAGGSLASYVTALVASPKLLDLFQKKACCGDKQQQYMSHEDFPEITGLCSVYGVLDASTFRQPLETISWLEWAIAVHGLEFCMNCYQNPKVTDFPHHFCDLLTDSQTSSLITNLPPTLLVCGTQDPLVHSTLKASSLLLGPSAKVHLFEARHAFVGLPRVSMGPQLRCQAAKADSVIRNFVQKQCEAARGVQNNR